MFPMLWQGGRGSCQAERAASLAALQSQFPMLWQGGRGSCQAERAAGLAALQSQFPMLWQGGRGSCQAERAAGLAALQSQFPMLWQGGRGSCQAERAAPGLAALQCQPCQTMATKVCHFRQLNSATPNFCHQSLQCLILNRSTDTTHLV